MLRTCAAWLTIFVYRWIVLGTISVELLVCTGHPQCMELEVVPKSGHVIVASLVKFDPMYYNILHLAMN